MTFYEQVRSFFKKYDPSRIRLARKIAATYKSPNSQKEVMKRLHEVYAAGGPSKFDFSKSIEATKEKPKKIEAVQETVEVEESQPEINNSDDDDELQEVV